MFLARGVQPTYRKHNTHHMEPSHFFFFYWSCCGPCLQERKKQSDLSSIFRCRPNEVSRAKSGALKTKRTDETKWTKGGATLYLPSKHTFVSCLPFILWYQSHFPPPTGSSCRNYRWALSLWQGLSFVWREPRGDGGFRGKKNWEDEEKQRFLLCSSAVLFVALFSLCVWR